MKSATLLFIVTTLGLTILSVWAYLLLFGAPDGVRNLLSTTRFSDLVTSEDTIPRGDAVVVSEESPVIDTDSADINQLTTRPVAGFVATTTPAGVQVWYVERGTGHIFAIDLDTGTEVRLSGKTFAKVVEAKFSPMADILALGLEHNNTMSYVVGGTPRSEESSFELIPLPEGSQQVSLLSGQVRYAVPHASGMSGYQIDLDTQKTSLLFSIPIRDGVVLWSTGDTMVMPRTAPNLTGAVYRISGNTLEAITEPHFAFSGLVTPDGTGFVGSYFEPDTDSFTTEYWAPDSPSVSIPSYIVPEKCAFVSEQDIRLVCGNTWMSERPRTYLVDWYKGIRANDDQLWDVNLGERSAWLIADPEDALGVSIDVIDLEVFAREGVVLMRNKVNDTLIVYYLPEDTH